MFIEIRHKNPSNILKCMVKDGIYKGVFALMEGQKKFHPQLLALRKHINDNLKNIEITIIKEKTLPGCTGAVKFLKI